MAGQVDRFGRPIPADPGYKEIINADGEVLQMRTTLFLDETITATDDPDSDATRLHGTPPAPVFSNVVETIENVSALRTYAVTATTYKTIIRTRQYGAYGARLGAWDYYYDPDSTDADDGVLTFESPFYDGRFKAVRPDDGIIDALACGPAAADLGSRTKSFDPTGAVGIGNELFRVTTLLVAAGWYGVEFPNAGTKYKCSGGEQIAPRLSPHVGFYVGSESGALLEGPESGTHVAAGGIGASARGLGDTGTTSTIIVPDQAGNLTFTMTVNGGERVIPGVSNVLGLAVGDTVILYLGADITDTSAQEDTWLMAEIEAIAVTASPVGTVTIKQSLPGPMPATPGSRGAQTSHTMRKMVGWQDNLVVRGFRFQNAQLGFQAARNAIIDVHFTNTTFAHNHFICSGMVVERFTADTITGYDQGGGGAFSWYGLGVVLQKCYGTLFNLVKVENLDGVSLITEELGSRGTRVELCDVNWNATNSWNSSLALFGQTAGSTDIISVGHLITRGGNAQATMNAAVSIGIWEDRGSSVSQTFGARADISERLIWRGQGYRAKKRLQTMVIPIPTGATTITPPIPCSGLIRDMNIRVQAPGAVTTLASIGITTLAVEGTAGTPTYDITSGFITAKNVWFPINPACILSVSCPNFNGYCSPQLRINTDGTTDPGTFLYVDVEMFIAEINTYGQPVTQDLSLPQVRGGAGAPSGNADFIGQEYIDSTATPNEWYKAISIGSGASDWVLIG